MKNKGLEFLVVDDREENRNAAKEAIEGAGDVVDFASNYEEGLNKVKNNNYAFCFFDLELPRKEEIETEKLGFELAKEAQKQDMPWAVITAGVYNHNGIHKCCYVNHYWDEINKPEDIQEKGIKVFAEKSNPDSWRKVYENFLGSKGTCENMRASMVRWKERFGKYVTISKLEEVSFSKMKRMFCRI